MSFFPAYSKADLIITILEVKKDLLIQKVLSTFFMVGSTESVMVSKMNKDCALIELTFLWGNQSVYLKCFKLSDTNKFNKGEKSKASEGLLQRIMREMEKKGCHIPKP